MKENSGPRTKRDHSTTKFPNNILAFFSQNNRPALKLSSRYNNSGSSTTKSETRIGQSYWSKIITEDLSYKSEGAWLKNEIQKQFCQFATHKDGAQNESIIMHSYHWRPPDDPIPQGSQLMSRAEALQKWNTLKSMGWERCAGPLR